MLIDRKRQKLLSAIQYFVENTRSCGKVKLFKLLYFLDFEHFKETGRSVTGLEYFAWPKGPVPVALQNEFEEIEKRPDFGDRFKISKKPTKKGFSFNHIRPLREIDLGIFTKREFRIMKTLAETHYDQNADSMVESTHLENLPWHQVYTVEGRRQKRIPYEYAIRKSDEEFIRLMMRERDEFTENYS